MSLSVFMIFLLISGCIEKKDSVPPSISFRADSIFTNSDRIIAIGAQVKIGITAAGGDAAITNFIVTMTTENGSERAVDSGLYSYFMNYEKTIFYGAEKFEKWSFTVRDKNGKSASASVTLIRDSTSTFGQITYLTSIIMGAQQNNLHGHFLSLPGGKLYFSDSASTVQQYIYMLAYYGDILSPPTEFTLSSPNETDAPSFYSLLSLWNIPKNEIHYKADSLSISTQEFDGAKNDSLIISNYTGATTGKRKFKSARAGYIIPFQITAGNLSGKKGLIKVKSVNNGITGSMELEIKIQK